MTVLKERLQTLNQSLEHIQDQRDVVSFSSQLNALWNEIDHSDKTQAICELFFSLSKAFLERVIHYEINAKQRLRIYNVIYKIQNAYSNCCDPSEKKTVINALFSTLIFFKAPRFITEDRPGMLVDVDPFIQSLNEVSFSLKQAPAPLKTIEEMNNQLQALINAPIKDIQSWLELQNEAFRPLQHIKKKSRSFSLPEILEYILLAIHISSEYISWLRRGHLNRRLISAIKHFETLIIIYNTYYQKTESADDEKKIFNDIVQKIQRNGFNLKYIEVCEKGIHVPYYSEQQRENINYSKTAAIAEYTLNFNELFYDYIKSPIKNNPKSLQNATILSVLDLGSESNDMLYQEYINHIFNSFVHILLKDHHVDHHFSPLHFIDSPCSTIDMFYHTEIDSILYEKIQIPAIKMELDTLISSYYFHKINYLTQCLKHQTLSIKQREILTNDYFTALFRKESYDFFFKDHLINDDIKVILINNCHQLQSSINYSTPLLQLLCLHLIHKIEHTLSTPPMLTPSQTLTPPSEKKEHQKISKKQKQKKKSNHAPKKIDTLYDVLEPSFIEHIFSVWAAWSQTLTPFIAAQDYDQALLYIETSIEALLADSGENKEQDYILFNYYFYKAIVLKQMERYDDALLALDESSHYQSPDFPQLTSQQLQRISCERAFIYQQLNQEQSSHAYFTQAILDANRYQTKCFTALLALRFTSEDLVSTVTELIEYLLQSNEYLKIDEYHLSAFYDCYQKIICFLFEQLVETFKKNLISTFLFSHSNTEVEEKITQLKTIYTILIHHAEIFFPEKTSELSYQCVSHFNHLMRFKPSPEHRKFLAPYYQKINYTESNPSLSLTKIPSALETLFSTSLENNLCTLLNTMSEGLTQSISIESRLQRLPILFNQYNFLIEIRNTLSLLMEFKAQKHIIQHYIAFEIPLSYSIFSCFGVLSGDATAISAYYNEQIEKNKKNEDPIIDLLWQRYFTEQFYLKIMKENTIEDEQELQTLINTQQKKINKIKKEIQQYNPNEFFDQTQYPQYINTYNVASKLERLIPQLKAKHSSKTIKETVHQEFIEILKWLITMIESNVLTLYSKEKECATLFYNDLISIYRSTKNNLKPTIASQHPDFHMKSVDELFSAMSQKVLETQSAEILGKSFVS